MGGLPEPGDGRHGARLEVDIAPLSFGPGWTENPVTLDLTYQRNSRDSSYLGYTRYTLPDTLTKGRRIPLSVVGKGPIDHFQREGYPTRVSLTTSRPRHDFSVVRSGNRTASTFWVLFDRRTTSYLRGGSSSMCPGLPSTVGIHTQEHHGPGTDSVPGLLSEVDKS